MFSGMPLLYGIGILGILGGLLYFVIKLNKTVVTDKKKENKSEKTD